MARLDLGVPARAVLRHLRHDQAEADRPALGHKTWARASWRDRSVMKHPANRDLFAHWNEQRGRRIAPDRGDIAPGAIRHVLADAFFLLADASYPFRLAGTRLCALFGRELKGESFLELWETPAQMRELVDAVASEKIGLVAQASGRTAEGVPLVPAFELLLLPLTQHGHIEARILGALAPLSRPPWLGISTIKALKLGQFRHIGPAVERAAPAPLVAGKASRLRSGFSVYQGGRTE